MKLTPGKLAGMKGVSDKRGVIAAAAMDQRGSLQKALAKEKDEAQRQRLIRGLLGCNGLSDTEQLEALEAYASKFASAESRKRAEAGH